MFRRVALGLTAFGVVALAVLGPASAQASQEWAPASDRPTDRIYVEPKVQAEDSNAIQTAFEDTLDGLPAKRYVYVARLPETLDTEAAARQVVSAWKLDRTKDSLLFYDDLGQRWFVWPASEKTQETANSLPEILNPSDFAGQFPKLYSDNANEQSSNEIAAVTDTFSSTFKSFGPLLILVAAFLVIMTLLRIGRY